MKGAGPTRRTGGRTVKVHLLTTDASGIANLGDVTLCGRPYGDVSYTANVSRVTCRLCKRSIAEARRFALRANRYVNLKGAAADQFIARLQPAPYVAPLPERADDAVAQPMFYLVAIDAVDGTTHYTCGTDDPAVGLAFLAQHDHEGSALALKVVPVRPGRTTEVHGEAVYERLRADASEGRT